MIGSARTLGFWLSSILCVPGVAASGCHEASPNEKSIDARADAFEGTDAVGFPDAAADVGVGAEAGTVPDPVGFEPYAPPTTEPDIAIGNLNGQIESYAELLRTSPQNDDMRSALVGALLSRSAFLGSYSDFDHAFEAVAGWPAGSGLAAALARARVLNAVHRFEEARSLLETSSPSSEHSRLDLLETIDIATGARLEDVYASRKGRALSYPSFATFAGAAAAAAALGSHAEADDLYGQALHAYRDVSPFPVAFVHFQRGVMWGEMADRPERARLHYEEAVRLLPGYVVANVHLAELEAQDGPGGLASALARLRRVSAQTEDPEPTGFLGELLLARGDPEGARLIAKAAEMYRALLSRHRAAFADHASEFFAGPGGDPDFALTLALENLALRATPRAYIVAIGAAESAGQKQKACELAAAASTLPATSENLRVLAAEVFRRCMPLNP